jgi:geranylgeranyl diphosphate synthase type I
MDMDIVAFKRRFDPILGVFLDKKMKEMAALTRDSYILEIAEHGRTLVMEGGKRIRPYLAYIAYGCAKRKAQSVKTDKEILEILVGLELFHAFALVHDDIMDRGKDRHGVPTANRKFGDAQAILLGDLLFNWASEIIAPTRGQPVFVKMVDEVILGQMLDVDAIRRDKVSDGFIQDKMRLKTVSYSFIRPMQFGVALAGVGAHGNAPSPGNARSPGASRVASASGGGANNHSPLHEFCERFGLPLGLAFQIQDDLLDLTASSKKLGKSAMNDVREGQKTVFSQYASRKPANRTFLNKMKGKNLNAGDRRRIKEMFEESGAIKHGTKLMEGYFATCDLRLAELPSAKAQPFKELVAYIKNRQA